MGGTIDTSRQSVEALIRGLLMCASAHRVALCDATADELLQASGVMRALLEQLAAEKRRFAEHLDAWRANNEAHAKRIAELERPAKCPRTHTAVKAFWKTYNRMAQKHGYYESTWAAIDAALAAKGD